MNDDYIREPILEKSKVRIVHPIIDFYGENGHFGIWLRSRGSEESLFLITSSREIISAQDSELARYNLAIKENCPKLENRWSVESIKDFTKSANSFSGIDLFSDIKGNLEYYIEFPEPEDSELISLWIIGTYMFVMFETYPYIFTGGLKRTGKSRTHTVSSFMAFNSQLSTSITASSLFRLVHNVRPTLFIDETETLIDKNKKEEFRAILLSGYKKGARAYRTEDTKKGYEVRGYDVYSPKMIANIKGLEDVLADRCITITMIRTKNREIGDRDPNQNDPIWQEIRDKCFVYALEDFNEIREIYLTIENKTKLKNREWELWKPILAIALHIDPDELYPRMIEYANKIGSYKIMKEKTETFETELIEVLLEMVKEDGYYRNLDIVEALNSNYDNPQNYINSKKVGRAMDRIGFKDSRRMSRGTEYFLKRENVVDIAIRYDVIEDTNEKETTLTTLTTLSTLTTPI